MTTLTDVAKALYTARKREEDREEQEKQRQTDARAEEAFHKTFGFQGSARAGVVACDGLLFESQYRGGGPPWRLRRTCPHCGKAVPSGEMRSLEDLGMELSRPEDQWIRPHLGGCPVRQAIPEPTAAERLAQAIVDVIADSGLLQQG